MTDIIYRLINVLPGVVISFILIYYTSKKKIPGLTWLLIAYIVVTLLGILSNFGMVYIYQKAWPLKQMQQFYETIGVISLIANTLMTIGIGVLLNSYPAPKQDR